MSQPGGPKATTTSASPADRLLGVLLFLPVPLVLFLFTRAPLGVDRSLGLGVVIMATHPLYARAFALARAQRRCIWCGGSAGSGPILEVVEPGTTSKWRACGEAHATLAGSFFAWTDSHRGALRGGILGTLALFLIGALLAERGMLGGVSFADTVAFFRLGIALTVLPAGFLAARAVATGTAKPRLAFPLHVPALVGIVVVLWLFRLIGMLWLAQALYHVTTRLG